MPSSASPRYIRYRDVREETVDELLFIIDEQEKAIHALSPSSAAIWSLLVEPTSVHDTKRLVREAFPEVSARRIASDIDALFSDLKASRLIRLVESASKASGSGQ